MPDPIDHEFIALHKRWQEHLNAMIAAGSNQNDAIESMLTVALAGKMQLDGPLQLACSLLFLGKGFVRLAEKPHQVH